MGFFGNKDKKNDKGKGGKEGDIKPGTFKVKTSSPASSDDGLVRLTDIEVSTWFKDKQTILNDTIYVLWHDRQGIQYKGFKDSGEAIKYFGINRRFRLIYNYDPTEGSHSLTDEIQLGKKIAPQKESPSSTQIGLPTTSVITADYTARIDKDAPAIASSADKDLSIYEKDSKFTELVKILENSGYGRVAVKFLNHGYWGGVDTHDLEVDYKKCKIHDWQFFRDPKDAIGYKEMVENYVMDGKHVLLEVTVAVLYRQNGYAQLKEGLPFSFLHIADGRSIKGKG